MSSLGTAGSRGGGVGRVVASASGSWISYTHTVCAFAAFLSALSLGLLLHYRKIVKNEFYGWPQEWFPSVSAAIGDWYPERSFFQLFIAICSGPRFALLFFWYLLTRRPKASSLSSSSSHRLGLLPELVFISGLMRTMTCAGWVYITSTDDHDWHDIFMISYLVLTIPWMVGGILVTPPGQLTSLKRRKRIASLFFGTIIPLVYFFIQHKVKRIAGAYTIYAFFEWSLVVFDITFDALTASEFGRLELHVVDLGPQAAGMGSKGDGHGNFLGPPLRWLKDDEFREREGIDRHDFSKTHPREFDNGGFGVLSCDSIMRVMVKGGEIPKKEIVQFASDTYLAFIHWTIWTALGPMIFYWSTWELSLTGWEALLFVTLSPLLLVIPPLRSAAVNNQGLFHLISLMALGAYLIQEDPMLRLQVVGLGLLVSSLNYAAMWWGCRDKPVEMERKALTFGIGLVSSLVAKYSLQSLNPFWPFMKPSSGGWNHLGFFLALLASVEVTMRGQPSPIERLANPSERGKKGFVVLASLGWGGLMFFFHTFLTDSGTIIVWTWEGYPIRGPLAVPHGALVIAAISFGLVIPTILGRLPTSPLSIIAGSLGLTLLYRSSNWTAFFGGLLFVTVVASALPGFLRQIAQYNPAIGFFPGFFVYNVLLLANVWATAYAFVPLGIYMRERTGLVLVISMILFAIGALNSRLLPSLNRMVKAHDLPSLERTRYQARATLAGLTFLAFAISLHRLRGSAPQPYHSKERILTAGIWTLHFGLDGFGWESQRRARDLIRDMELDVVGLLESDLQRVVNGNRDMTQFLAEDLGMYADYGPGPDKHTWGAALLSKFPILNSTHLLLPSPHGELAPAIHATLDVYGEKVDVIVSHNGQEEDALDRRLQSEELGRIMREAYPRPFVFLGYVVTRPNAPKPWPYKYLVEDGKMHDIEAADWDRWCEYILFRGLYRIGYARVTRGSYPAITDTELQVGRFILPSGALSPEHVSYHRIKEVPDTWKFTQEFKGFGHAYHVLNEPNPEPWYYAFADPRPPANQQ